MEHGNFKSIYAWSSVVASLFYCYFIPARIPKGFLRLVSLLPVFCHFTVLPMYMPSIFFRGVSTLFITWLANSKLLLFAFGQGPLAWAQSQSLHIFIASAALPIRAKRADDSNPSSSKKKVPFLNLGTEILALSVLLALAAKYRETAHPLVLQADYCCVIFLLVDVLVAFSSSVVRAMVGLELEPPSNAPYASTSLQDFWGKRWNLTVTNTLRLSVYKPVRSVSAGVVGNRWAALPAFFATFLVSGLMHELIYYYVSRAKPSWEVTWFFILHGICVMIELVIKRGLKGKREMPWFISGPLTMGFVIITSFWLFFPPLMKSGADEMVLEEFRSLCESWKGRLGTLSPNILSPNLS
ncbi:unnamed protein product [Coffea canephora]|uniref:DH200=94 genomic scaffold, scaffold_796 n=2 Tax=Coffea TaxID=13442 RepID=A0A068VJT8_COFCA|nr:long-chain-alcohol O-fatty-acyltransferase-like [Coffea arabica]CDP19938.1 unnamed protein product [Coffea canephora]